MARFHAVAAAVYPTLRYARCEVQRQNGQMFCGYCQPRDMAEIDLWEKRFVEAYVEKSVRERYLAMLKGKKHRQKLLDRLNHAPGFDFSKARRLDVCDRETLLRLLGSLRVEPTGYVMADSSNLDGHEVRVELAVDEMLHTMWGAVLICPPKPVAIYREESPGAFYLFS